MKALETVIKQTTAVFYCKGGGDYSGIKSSLYAECILSAMQMHLNNVGRTVKLHSATFLLYRKVCVLWNAGISA